MKYDFTSHINRRGHDAIAVEVIPIPNVTVKDGFSTIPMWVADMNFPTLPTITEAIQQRVLEPHFGYFNLSEDYFDSIIYWQKCRHLISDLKQEYIGYENGVLGCVSSVVREFTEEGDAILLHAPAYIGFIRVLEETGRKIVYSKLVKDEKGIWRMDYEDMAKKMEENQIKLVIFCSPHNPTGRVWEREEIEQAMEVYASHDCTVISDEIWSDLILPGYIHTPTQSVSQDAKERTVAVYAPSKTFNLAGLVGSYHIIYNEELRRKVEKRSSMCFYNSCNVLSMHALIGAYCKEGEQWVDELCETLQKNVDYAYDFIQNHFQGVTLSKPQGTYMLYLNCEEWCKKNDKTLDELLAAGVSVGVIWQDGRPFQWDNTIRMNLALPYDLVVEAMERLYRYVF
ncbi:MAG: MalY/PatB family protein [Lachnospiraceae bacterium]